MEQVRKILKRIYKAHLDRHDTVLIITGPEGFGKSNLLLDIATEWGKITGRPVTMDFIALTPQKWLEAIDKATPVIGMAAFDEAGDGLFNRDAMNNFNRDVVKLYTVIRGKGLFSILVLPSFWILDPYFRLHRVKGLFYVYNRGRVAFWNKQQVKALLLKGEHSQDIWAVKPSFKDAFPIYKGPLLDAYAEEKKDKIERTIRAMREKYAQKEDPAEERNDNIDLSKVAL